MLEDEGGVLDGRISVFEPNGSRPISQTAQSDRVEDDLDWILSKFAARAMADEVALTIQRNDDPPELLARIDPKRGGVLSQLTLMKALDREAAEPERAPTQSSLLQWQDVQHEQQTSRVLRLNLAEAGQLRVVLTAIYIRSNVVKHFAAEQMARKLQPVLAGYFRLWLHARNQHRTLTALKSALDISDVAVIILDENGAVIEENSAARSMFEKKDVVNKSRYSLVAVSRGDTAKLHAAMDRASTDGQPVLINLNRRGYARPLMAIMSPTSSHPEVSSDPSFVLCIYDSDKDLTVSLQRCCDAYGLTKTESRLVHNLVCGSTISESAFNMKIAEATARSYLKHIFSKTGTNRQTGLVRTMLMSIARTSCSQLSIL